MSQVHRLRALVLLGRFLDMGSWAVDLALSVGIFPYVLKLLQTTSSDLRTTLVFIWAKILALDRSCQVRHRHTRGPVLWVGGLCVFPDGRKVKQRIRADVTSQHAWALTDVDRPRRTHEMTVTVQCVCGGEGGSGCCGCVWREAAGGRVPEEVIDVCVAGVVFCIQMLLGCCAVVHNLYHASRIAERDTLGMNHTHHAFTPPESPSPPPPPQADLVKDSGHLYFLKYLDAPEASIDNNARAQAAFVLAVVCDGHSKGQALCAAANLLQVGAGV